MSITRLTKEERHAAILTAAGEVFAREGYVRARVDAIARTARVGKGTIYEHFGSKENLLCSYLSHLVHQTVDALTEEAGQDQNPRRALTRLIRGLVESIEPMIPVMGLFFEAWNLAATRADMRSRVVDTFREMYTPVLDLIADLVRRGRREGLFGAHQPKDVASLVVATIDGLAYQALFILDPGDLPRMARRTEKLLIQGLDLRP
ncbi:MAG: hypothetical protein CL908_15890 [Deltaproteobacteria bacterium]|nr:hypothetical protein [Deltaproteobacteria bacterium]